MDFETSTATIAFITFGAVVIRICHVWRSFWIGKELLTTIDFMHHETMHVVSISALVSIITYFTIVVGIIDVWSSCWLLHIMSEFAMTTIG